MRRIALLFEYSTLNGGERSMLAAIDWLQKNDRRFEFVAIAPLVGRLADCLCRRSIPIQEWSPYSAEGIRRSAEDIQWSLRNAVEAQKPALLHGNSLTMGRLVGRMASVVGIPTTAHLRDIVKLSANASAELNRNCHLIAVSAATREFHISQAIDASRICIVRNGIDLQAFSPRKSTGYLHAELGLPFVSRELEVEVGAAPIRLIAMIGQIGLRKGQDVLADAAPLIVRQVPGAHFVFIGERTSHKDESIRFEQSIRTQFVKNGIVDRLHFLGYRDDVAGILNEVDVLAHPANQEPYGRVLLEGSAAGVPIVATHVGGTSEIVIHGETGLLVPARTPPALASGIVDVLIDGSLAGRFRRAARHRAESEFDVSKAARSLADIWGSILD